MNLRRKILLLLSWVVMAVGIVATGTSNTAFAQSGGIKYSHAGPVPATHTVREGDTLWDLAQAYLKDPYEWPKLWSYNPQITNPHWIYPNSVVRLRPEGDDGAGDGSAAPGSGISWSGPARSNRLHLGDQGYLDDKALDASGEIVGSHEEEMMLTAYDEVFIKFSDKATPKRGDVYAIYRPMKDEERIETEIGELGVFGTVEILSYDAKKKIARAQIGEALDPIERGFRVAEIPRSFDVANPVPAEKDIRGKVIAALRPRMLSASNQIFFIDKGEKDGVKIGNPVYVVRKYDEWRHNLGLIEADETGAIYIRSQVRISMFLRKWWLPAKLWMCVTIQRR